MPKRKCSSVDSSLGENLIYYRKLTGLTQQQIADALNLNRTTYTKYETGVSEPSIEILKKIAELLEADLSLLLSDRVDEGNIGDSELEAVPALSAEQRNLLKKYNALSREDREEIVRHMNQLLKDSE